MSEANGHNSVWRPSGGDLIGIAALVAAAIMWLTQPNWQIGLPLSVLIIGVVIFTAARHQSHPIRRALVAASVIGIYIYAAWAPISKSLLADYPNLAFHWPITFSATENNDILPQTQSRLDRFIFTCDVAQPKSIDEEKSRNETLRKNAQALADTLGLKISFSDIPNGIQAKVEAKTKEAQARLASMGIVPGVTTFFLQSRWIAGRQIIVAYASVPKEFLHMSGLMPDPTDPNIIMAQNMIAQLIQAPQGACALL